MQNSSEKDFIKSCSLILNKKLLTIKTFLLMKKQALFSSLFKSQFCHRNFHHGKRKKEKHTYIYRQH